MDRAADLAAAALLDTIEACAAAYGVPALPPRPRGRPGRREPAPSSSATPSPAGRSTPSAATTSPSGSSTPTTTSAAASGAPVVQVGMDTPQLDVRALLEVEAMLTGPDDAVLGPAYDGGWWLLGVGGPHLLDHLGSVPMSTDETGELTRQALVQRRCPRARDRDAARRRRGGRRRRGRRRCSRDQVREGVAMSTVESVDGPLEQPRNGSFTEVFAHALRGDPTTVRGVYPGRAHAAGARLAASREPLRPGAAGPLPGRDPGRRLRTRAG